MATKVLTTCCPTTFECEAVLLTEAKKFHAYAQECLQLAERAIEPDVKKSLIEFSHIWMEAALNEERNVLDKRFPKAVAK